MGKKLNQKSFCKWGKDDIKKNIATVLELTAAPKFVCLNCARTAKRKVNLCKPLDIEKAAKSDQTI